MGFYRLSVRTLLATFACWLAMPVVYATGVEPLQVSMASSSNSSPIKSSEGSHPKNSTWTVGPGDTLAGIARQLGVPLDGLAAANAPLDLRGPPEIGAVLKVPDSPLAPSDSRDGLVVNLPEMRVYRFSEGVLADVFPIGIGRAGNDTPLLETVITSIDKNPEWRPPISIREEYRAVGQKLPAVVEPGPDNPLGGYALRLAEPGYLLHGTNSPAGVGLRVSHGCIRLYNEHAEALADVLSVGTRVRIINEPLKWQISDEGLLLEVYRPLTGSTYGGTSQLRDHFDLLRSALKRQGLSVQRFDSWVADRHARGELFNGLVHHIPVDRLLPAS